MREVQNVDRLKLDLNQKGIIDAVDNNNNNNGQVANSVIGADGVKTHLAGNVDWQTKMGQNQQLQKQQQSVSASEVGYTGAGSFVR